MTNHETEPVCKFEQGCHRVVPCDPGCAAAAAVSVPPPATRADDRDALRDRIAEALLRWAERGNDPQYASMRRPETVRANAYSRADAVLAVLPDPADPAASYRLAADAVRDTIAPADWDADAVSIWNTATNIAEHRLRRLAAEAPTTTKPETTAVARVREWVTSDVVTARSGFGDGYREAQRDIRDLLDGRPLVDGDDQPEPAAGVRQDGAEENA